MDLENIAIAFEKALAAIGSFPTAYENSKFEPTNGTPFQRLKLVPREPENPTLGDGFHREVGQFQVFLCYPTNAGAGAAMARAAVIKNAFPRGTTLIEGTTRVIVRRTPQISGGMTIQDRYVVPVLIEYFANVDELV